MDMFINSEATPALTELTSVYRALEAHVEIVRALYKVQKDCLGRNVPMGHDLHNPRLREQEVAEIRLTIAREDLFPLIEPVKTAYLAVQNEIPDDIGGRYGRAARVGMANVMAAIELYEVAAALYYELELRENTCISGIGFTQEYERITTSTDYRVWTVRFNDREVFQPPYMNPAEILRVNNWTHGQVSITGEVRNVVTGEAAYDISLNKAYLKDLAGDPQEGVGVKRNAKATKVEA
jgi:hypothetical protein